METTEAVVKQAVSELVAQGGPFAAAFIIVFFLAVIGVAFVWRDMRDRLNKRDQAILDMQEEWRADLKLKSEEMDRLAFAAEMLKEALLNSKLRNTR
jgi:hypothetical protein